MGRRWLWVALVLLGLLLWWGALLQQVESSVFVRVPMLDEQQYLSEARYFSDGRLEENSSKRPFFMSPIYPRLLALLKLGAGQSQELVYSKGFFNILHWLQVMLWMGTVVLLRMTAGRMFAENIGARSYWLWVPSVLFVFYRTMAIYTMMVLVEMPLVFLITLLLFFLSCQSENRLVSAANGLVLALAVLLRGSVLVLAPLVVVVLLRKKMPRRESLIHLSLFAVTLLALLLPPMIHNSRLTGTLSAPSLNGGLNLFLGNGPQATGLGTSLPGDWLADPAGTVELSRRLQSQPVTVAEADQLWRRLALDTMAEDPLRVLGLWLKKMHLQTQSWEMDQVTSLDGWRQEVPLLKFQFVPWWALVVPGVWGLLALNNNRRNSALLTLIGVLLCLMSIQSLFFVVSRYRMVLVPVFCLLALAGILEVKKIIQQWNQSGLTPKIGLFLAVGASLALINPWGLDTSRTTWAPLALAQHAQRWAILGAEENDPDALKKSLDIYEISMGMRPDQAGPYLGLSAVLRELNRSPEAEDVLQKGIPLVEDDLELRRGLLMAHLAAGRPQKALEVAQGLLAQYPSDGETLHNASVLLAQLGQQDAAQAMARRLIKAHPTQAQGYLDLGVLLARAGHSDLAKKVFQQGLIAKPGHPMLVKNLDRISSTN